MVYKEAVKSLNDQIAKWRPTQYFDRYTNTTRDIMGTYNPFFPTIDAIEAFTCIPDEDGELRTRTHAAPNVVMVPYGLNIAKCTHQLSSVAEIGDNCRLSVAASKDEKDALDKKLINQVAEQRVIAIKYSTYTKNKMEKTFTKKAFQVARQDFRSGSVADVKAADVPEMIQ